jgi:hypothetical protein
MLHGETVESLALANTAILMQLIEELIEHGVIGRQSALLRDAASDLGSCPESSIRVDDAIRIIRKELMPRIMAPPAAS